MFKCPGFGLVDLLKGREQIVGVEIGHDAGVTAEYLLVNLPQLRLYSIDPYGQYIDWNGNPVHNSTLEYEKAIERTARFSDRFALIREPSDVAKVKFADESLDFIFIDGLHTYDGVTQDCHNYYQKMKPGALFSGHDYNVISVVGNAVRDFARSVGKDILQTEVDVWYWYK
jgi:predicted O-methyltransferase YrrM